MTSHFVSMIYISPRLTFTLSDQLTLNTWDSNLIRNKTQSIYYYSILQFNSNTEMYRESYILFKQFLPKERDFHMHKPHETINLQLLTKHLENQPKNNSLHKIKYTTLSRQPLSFSKPFSEQYVSSKKVLKLKTRGNLSNLATAKITQHSNRSQLEFVDDNVWRHLSQNKTKRFEDLAKEIPRKMNKPHMAIIFKTNKEMIVQNRQNQEDFVKRNLIALRKIVRSQSEQRHILQLRHLDLLHAKKAQFRSNVAKHDLHQQLLRKQKKNDLKLKMLSRIAQNSHGSEKLIIKEIKKGEKKANPERHLNLTNVPVDLKAGKVIFQRKNSLKREIIDKIRRERTGKRELVQKQSLQDLKYISSYVTHGDQTLPNHNSSFHIKRRFKSEQSQLDEVDNPLSNQTQKCQKMRAKWDDFIGQAIQPW